jgi:hypothetical protein
LEGSLRVFDKENRETSSENSWFLAGGGSGGNDSYTPGRLGVVRISAHSSPSYENVGENYRHW